MSEPTVKVWAGHEVWCCPVCSFDHEDRQRVIEHVAARHPPPQPSLAERLAGEEAAALAATAARLAGREPAPEELARAEADAVTDMTVEEPSHAEGIADEDDLTVSASHRRRRGHDDGGGHGE